MGTPICTFTSNKKVFYVRARNSMKFLLMIQTGSFHVLSTVLGLQVYSFGLQVDCSRLRVDCSGLRVVCSGLRVDCSGLRVYVQSFFFIELTKKMYFGQSLLASGKEATFLFLLVFSHQKSLMKLKSITWLITCIWLPFMVLILIKNGWVV